MMLTSRSIWKQFCAFNMLLVCSLVITYDFVGFTDRLRVPRISLFHFPALLVSVVINGVRRCGVGLESILRASIYG